ncbi:hypothetical protein ERO13_A07G155726v2 [Gossypium hirsutum]|uniref:C2 domain-containing protein At1g53590 n=1 Tax=Gossypium hirsutum TaxID=3635 RepID=A0A1U8JAP3_GOSHI|nr:C2 domain-containing protein At1g53590 [Gossypium hirsutum]KAG4192415.1 hypothetical protein ERO13_A07G155726v2 [Gossypium hirsutum]
MILEMEFMEVSIMHHIGLIFMLLWLLSCFNLCNAVAYFVSLVYLYSVHAGYIMRLRKKLEYEERQQSYRRRVFSESESVRWLNHAVEKIWPICIEQIVSQKILLPIIPWFLDKYKPWTAKKAVVQHLYLGRNAPLFTGMRVLHQCPDDDHLVMELGMNFLTADDMNAVLAVKLRKRLGFGMWAKLHITGMHVEIKVKIGVKFLRQWPFLSRLRLCFVELPYFQMTVKPIFNHGLNVTEVPGIAAWLDKLLSLAFEQTLVEPNMLVVDVLKFASPQPENWFTVNENQPRAHAKVEVVEAADMKPSDSNGLADPYVKGQLGSYRFKTKTHKKTLFPKWHEEFMIPISSWKSPNVLVIEVFDKDHFVDDTLGKCTVNIHDLRGGRRHDMWLTLQSGKTGRLHLAITVVEDNTKGNNGTVDAEALNKEDTQKALPAKASDKGSSSPVPSKKPQNLPDHFEPINIEGQQETCIWFHQPGSEVSQTWQPRKGKGRSSETQIDGVSTDSFGGTLSGGSESPKSDSNSSPEAKINRVKRGLQKISLAFNSSKSHEGSLEEVVQTPNANFRTVNDKEDAVKLAPDDNLPSTEKVSNKESSSSNESSSESPSRMKGMAKSFLKHAEKSARQLKCVLSIKGRKLLESSMVDQEFTLESESSGDESMSSPADKRLPTASNPVSTASSGNTETQELDVVLDSSNQVDQAITIERRKEDNNEVNNSNKLSNAVISLGN